jgi:hypothetical protein
MERETGFETVQANVGGLEALLLNSPPHLRRRPQPPAPHRGHADRPALAGRVEQDQGLPLDLPGTEAEDAPNLSGRRWRD